MDGSRGRGRVSNPWNRGGSQNITSKKDVPKANVTAKLRFEEAQARLQASVQKHIKPDYESSSEEDELESDNILVKLDSHGEDCALTVRRLCRVATMLLLFWSSSLHSGLSLSCSVLITPLRGVPPRILGNLVEVGLNPTGNQVRCRRETGDRSGPKPTSLEQGLASCLGVRGLIDWPTSLEQGLASCLGVRGLIDWPTSLEQGLASCLGSYSQLGGKSEDLGRTQRFLEDAFQSGAATCLICIASVKRNDAVSGWQRVGAFNQTSHNPDPVVSKGEFWTTFSHKVNIDPPPCEVGSLSPTLFLLTGEIWSCVECYSFFHLTCIQRWSKDSIAHQKQALEDVPLPNVAMSMISRARQSAIRASAVKLRILRTTLGWFHTPVGRLVAVPYNRCAAMTVFYFVTQVEKLSIASFCDINTHNFLFQGPCPPCPKTVKCVCYCGKQPARLQRCSRKTWSCGTACGRMLQCGRHPCEEVCHPGDCPACPKTSKQLCQCGAQNMVRPCATPVWNCAKSDTLAQPVACLRGFDSRHGQEFIIGEICAANGLAVATTSVSVFVTKGSVGFAPCQSRALVHVAKPPSFFRAPRTHPPVVIHARDSSTVERTSAPGRVTATNCLEVVTKSCRCGLHKKELPCQKEYLCETKCKRLKDCIRHPCNRKCCDGTCPPCEKICGRTLPCGNHKCVSVCHRGLCYPCPLNEQVKCRCGNTAITVPCGRKRKTKPPRCNRQCKIEADCHHPKRENHKCHFGDCPPCRQVCGKVRADCPHPCPALCHSAVWVRVDGDHKPAGPWEKVTPQLQMVDLPCPNCMVPVPVTCVGGHETCDWPCHRAKPSSCHRTCGRALSCGNHLCSLLCHTVTGAKDNVTSGNECEQCESGCTKPRPKGCSHPCTRPCHPDSCPPCSQMVRLPCHCALNQKYVRCGEWVLADQGQRVDMQSCGNQCPRNAKELERLKQQMEVERKNQEEVERFQRKFQQRKKHKERHQHSDEDSRSLALVISIKIDSCKQHDLMYGYTEVALVTSLNLFRCPNCLKRCSRNRLDFRKRDWFIHFDDVATKWRAQPTFILSQVTVILGGLATLIHALRNGGRLPYLWLAIFLHGIVVELLSYNLNDIDSFWHSQAPIMFVGRRLPLHILLIYSVVIYNASVAVSKARLPNWAEPFAVGLVAVLVDIPYDIVSVKFLHWTWHDTDPNIFDRHYWVPWNSYYFHAAFSASFIFWFHGWHRWVTSEENWWRELFVAVMAALLGMPGGILLFIPIYHPLHDLFKVHTEVCVVLLLTGFFLIVWSTDRNPIGGARPSTGRSSSGSDRRILLVLHLVQYYALFLGMTIFGEPQEEVSIGLHETTGPCDKIAYVRTPVGLELSKRKYLCVSNYSEDYYDFKCVPKGAPSEGKSWYTICGTPFTQRAEYLAVISGICILAFVVFYQLHYRSGDGVSSKHRKTRAVNTKQKKR
uniref:NF-X1-type domain-containing protein n=1 Tax=Timema bartmani TaxID=61472 RepID=A0A7R9EW44_9NEOP|nr:unnamed protein product [Timema bartmani]